MKKLCRKSTVHPSPPFISDFLSFLPAAIFTLTVALSPDDKEVLAYLISCSNFSGSRKSGRKLSAAKLDHAPLFDCDCFMCYRRYWARWDSSPNRQLIHEVIDAYEDGLLAKSKGAATTQRSCKKERRRQKNNESGAGGESNRSSSELSLGKSKTKEISDSAQQKMTGREEEEEEEEGGSVRRFVSFVGEKIWSAWI